MINETNPLRHETSLPSVENPFPQATPEKAKKTHSVATENLDTPKALEVVGRGSEAAPIKGAKKEKGSLKIKDVAHGSLIKTGKAQNKESEKVEKAASTDQASAGQRLKKMKQVPMDGLEKSIEAGKLAREQTIGLEIEPEDAERAAEAAKAEADFQARTIGVDSSSLPHNITDIEAAAAQRAERAQKVQELRKAIQSDISICVAPTALSQYMYIKEIRTKIAASLPQVRQTAYTDDNKLKLLISARLAEDGQVVITDRRNVEKEVFGIVNTDDYPSTMFADADSFEEQGLVTEAAELRQQAIQQEARMLKILKRILKNPVHELDKGVHYKEIELPKDAEYFHGTPSSSSAKAIKDYGFDLSFSQMRPLLDSGQGVYLAFDKQSAKQYAKVDKDTYGSVLKTKIKTKKIVDLSDIQWKEDFQSHCKVISANWVTDHAKDIVDSLEGLGRTEDQIKDEFATYLNHALFVDYFSSKGYEGIVTPNLLSNRELYLNVFDPKNVETLEVTKL